MELKDSQLNYFVENRLKLPKGKRQEYLGQVDRLTEKFTAAAKDDEVIGIKKFLKTGSLRKGTVLRPKGDFGVDADVAVFLKTTGATAYDLTNLHDRIKKLLAKTERRSSTDRCGLPIYPCQVQGSLPCQAAVSRRKERAPSERRVAYQRHHRR